MHTSTRVCSKQEGTKNMKIQALMLILDEHNAERIIKELQRLVRGFHMVCICSRLFKILRTRRPHRLRADICGRMSFVSCSLHWEWWLNSIMAHVM